MPYSGTLAQCFILVVLTRLRITFTACLIAIVSASGFDSGVARAGVVSVCTDDKVVDLSLETTYHPTAPVHLILDQPIGPQLGSPVS